METEYGRALLQWPLTFATITIFGMAIFTISAPEIDDCGPAHIAAALLPASRALAMLTFAIAPLMLVNITADMCSTSWWEALRFLPQVLTETHAGHVWGWFLPTLAALFLITLLPLSPVTRSAAVVIVASVMMLLEAMFSHAIDHGATGVAFYFVHEMAAGAWIGSLMALWISARRANASTEWTACAARKVSSIAAWSVVALVISGSYFAYLGLGLDWYRLVYSSYGRTLLAKVIAFSIVLSIGAYNRERLVPEISESSRQRVLLRNVGIESALLAILVIGLASLLANTPPATGHRMMNHSTMAMDTSSANSPTHSE